MRLPWEALLKWLHFLIVLRLRSKSDMPSLPMTIDFRGLLEAIVHDRQPYYLLAGFGIGEE